VRRLQQSRRIRARGGDVAQPSSKFIVPAPKLFVSIGDGFARFRYRMGQVNAQGMLNICYVMYFSAASAD
jgi:hypothetical protein